MISIAEHIYTSQYIEANECISKLEKKYERKLVVNPDLDRRIVSFQASKSEPIFRWFHYREGFSKQLVEYVLDSLNAPVGGLLLDPFAGTGSAPFVAAKYKNMQSMAFELMPVGTFFMKCRNSFASIDSSKLLEFAEVTLSSRDEWIKLDPSWKFNHLNITRDAFSPTCEYELCQYKTWLSKQLNPDYCLFLDFVAFSVLERFSFTRKDGQYLRWDYRSPRFRYSEKKPSFDKGEILTFHEALSEKLRKIISDLKIQEVQGNLFTVNQPIFDKPIEVTQGSVLERLEVVDDKSIDLVITSPPYCNRYDYTRTYALELAYLGVDEEGIRKLRQSLLK